MNTPAPAPARLFFLDWLRIAAFGLLVVYHVGMYYVRWDWHVKSPHAGPWLEPWMLLSSPWRLALLFLISGAATSLMLARGPARGWLGTRSKRLLLPLLCGMLLVVPPQPYFEVVHQHGYTGSYLDFLALYFRGHDGFCGRGGECLILPTWNHLWFVAYLWVYTLALWGLVKCFPRALDAAATGATRLLRGPALLWAPVAALALARVALAPLFPSTHALVDDWFNHATYFGVFLLGAAFARWPEVWEQLATLRRPALALALLAWALLALRYTGWLPEPMPPWLWQARGAVFAVAQWCAIVALLGHARRHWDRDHAWRRYLTDAVFPVYVLHQTLIIVFTQGLARWQLAPAIEGPVLVGLTLACSFAGYGVIRRVAWLRPWFGLARAPAKPPAGAALAA